MKNPKWYEENRDRLREYRRAWRRRNPNKVRDWNTRNDDRERQLKVVALCSLLILAQGNPFLLLATKVIKKRTERQEREHQIRISEAGRLKQCYRNLVMRCTDPRHISFPYYGGKGVKNFLTPEDLKFLWDRDGAAFMVKPSIDREKSDQDYRFENCRFIEQSLNSQRARRRAVA